MRKLIRLSLISVVGIFISLFSAFAQNMGGGVAPINVNSNGSNSPSNQGQPVFPQLQNSPFNNSGFQGASPMGGGPTMQAKTAPITASPYRRQGLAAPSFPTIAAQGANIIGQGASAFPAASGGSRGTALVPMAQVSSASGGVGRGALRPISNATSYSQAPTYVLPAQSSQHAAATSHPSSLVMPTAPSTAQTVTPTYVGPSAGGASSSPTTSITPKACVASGACK
jgi:hypothetical protein